MATKGDSSITGGRSNQPIATYSLGDFEAQVMNVVWDLEPPVTAREVFKRMYDERDVSYSSVMLTMAKLAKKGILSQTRLGSKRTDAFVYAPMIGREEMGKLMLDEVSRKVLGKPFYEVIRDLLPDCPDEEIRKLQEALKPQFKPRPTP